MRLTLILSGLVVLLASCGRSDNNSTLQTQPLAEAVVAEEVSSETPSTSVAVPSAISTSEVVVEKDCQQYTFKYCAENKCEAQVCCTGPDCKVQEKIRDIQQCDTRPLVKAIKLRQLKNADPRCEGCVIPTLINELATCSDPVEKKAAARTLADLLEEYPSQCSDENVQSLFTLFGAGTPQSRKPILLQKAVDRNLLRGLEACGWHLACVK